MSGKSSEEEVEAILAAREKLQNPPNDEVLLPLYRYLIPSSQPSNNESSSSHPGQVQDHWYCERAESRLHTEAATYLIFLFAFLRNGTAKQWLEALETVVTKCDKCARGFGAARRRLDTRYLSSHPSESRINFFGTVDTWQIRIIEAEIARASQPTYGSTTPRNVTLSSLSSPFTQLLLAEPTLLKSETIMSVINTTAVQAGSSPTISILGLTAVVAHLLRSEEVALRTWAVSLLQTAGRRPLSHSEWCANGIGVEVQALYTRSDLSATATWIIVNDLLLSGALSEDTIERGMLEGSIVLGKPEPAASVNARLVSVLGGDSSELPACLSCFSTLLSRSPNHHFWAFDSSPDLPHTLFSDIKNNPAFHTLLTDMSVSTRSMPSDKGKSSLSVESDPLKWLSGFLVSLTGTHGELDNERSTKDTAFPEALAKVMNYCFQEMQHGRYTVDLRAYVARAGLQGLTALMGHVTQTKRLSIHLDQTIIVHATFITSIALRQQEPPWADAQSDAQTLLANLLVDDAQSIRETVLDIAQISLTEAKRLKKVEESEKYGRTISDEIVQPRKVTTLPTANARREIWLAAYTALSPQDTSGLTILLKAIARFAHLEPLDRQRAWKADFVDKVVDIGEWTGAIRSINSAIKATRESFGTAVESMAHTIDSSILRKLWETPGAPRAAIACLLSPADDVHDPIIVLIQQSFDEVDDRGDCFRALLEHYPNESMDGLKDFLSSFIQTATFSPDACSLAKWLVRCFTDVLDALCRRSGSSDALLHSENFLASYSDGPMTKRISDLWFLMTTSLAVIFSRTNSWAHYDNEIMIDWMRDALIFGRHITEYIRTFEGAVLGHPSSQFGDVAESPRKSTTTGKRLVQQLEAVLTSLVLWLRLTDVETLHQTFELVKTILGRISKFNIDLSKSPDLEKTLLQIDKFCRRASRSYKSRLSDDLLAELAELLVPFNLSLEDDTVPLSAPTPKLPPPQPRKGNAFEVLMSAGRKDTTSKLKDASGKGSSSSPIEIDDDFEDSFLDHLSGTDLDIIEKRANLAATSGPSRPVVKVPPSQKLNINVVPKIYPAKPPARTGFKSKLMQDLRHGVRIDAIRQQAALGGVVNRLPAPSKLGSGIGAYTGPPRAASKPDSSGSSASESSDDDGGTGIGGLVNKQKSPIKLVKPIEKRPIKVIGDDMSAIIRQREDKRAAAIATKHRLKPDLSALFRFVLGWDPNHTGSNPPHPSKNAAALGPLTCVPSTFTGAKSYEQIILPIFLQELWAQCGKEQAAPPSIVVEVSGRTYEDDFLDIELSVLGDIPAGWYVNDTDIVRLHQHGNPRAVLAKVQAFKRKFKDNALKVRILNIMDRNDLGGKSKWLLAKHISLSTAVREYAALKGLPYYEPSLLQDILAGRSAALPRLADHSVNDAMRAFDVNEPQAKAILGAMSITGFALIQGPPGTGKTKTISGLVGKFMSERKTLISVNGSKPPKPKLLVCAPSNAAIDEVCKRLMDGVPSSSGGRLRPTIVRIGIDSSVNIAVKDVSLDSLVEAKVNADMSSKQGGGDYSKIQADLEEVKQAIQGKQSELKNAQGNDQQRKKVESDLHALNARRTQLGQASSKAKDAARDATRHLDGARRAARESVLNDADVICATLSGAGQDTLAPYIFETVIIDEAAQAIETSCLIPLKYGCKRCIMVGDPNQLPPTTFTQDADRLNYNQSLFVRVARQRGSHMHLLSIQYRMHPFISELPSKVFYHGQLKDGPNMAQKTVAVWHQRQVFGPYRFFNVEGTEIRAGTSTKNIHEAQVAVELYRRLEADFGARVNLAMRIGIITMYREQLYELKRQFNQAFGPEVLQTIEFNTVDGFQGQEKDIIILSCVRSGLNLTKIGFLSDFRRMNVALTRAKSSLFVIGNGPTLERSDEQWKTIIGDARDRGFFINYTPSTFAAEVIRPDPPKKKKIKKEEGANSASSSSQSLPVSLKARKPSTDSILSPKKEPKKRKTNPTPIDLASTPPPPSSAPDVAKQTTREISPPRGPSKSGSSTIGPEMRKQPAPSEMIPTPPTTAPPPPPPKRPPPRPEDVLFHKKKKKTNRVPPPTAPNVRAAINEKYRPNGRP